MMKFKVSASRTDVEHGIAPPMRQAVTLPAVIEMGARGADIIIYVCTPAFGPIRGIATSDKELKEAAKEIARRLNSDV
jgi:hypothetical protein